MVDTAEESRPRACEASYADLNSYNQIQELHPQLQTLQKNLRR